MTGFEVFKKRGTPVIKEPTVTVQKNGSIALNRPAYGALGEPTAIELLFDREERIIGMRGVSRKTGHSYPVRNTESNPGQYLISGVAFTKYYEIKTDVSRRYPAHVNEDGILCVDLKGPVTEITGNRNGHSSKPAAELLPERGL
jgi:hypothetical protein